MCPCPSKNHRITHCKCVLKYFKQIPSLSIPRLETNKYETNICSTIIFHVYRNLSYFTMHGQRPQKEHTTCYLCSTDASSVNHSKIYMRKEFVLIETYM